MTNDPQSWGLAPGYHDFRGRWREVPWTSVLALLDAMGAVGRAGPPGLGDETPVWVVRTPQEVNLDGGPWRLVTEDGGDERALEALPPDVPLGYHRLEREADGRKVLLVVAPGRCHLPEDLRTWGWAVQLYAVRSARSWGLGDLGDLGQLARWSAGNGAGVALLNPLHAVEPELDGHPGPYFPSSRCFRDPIYLRVEDVPGWVGADLDDLEAAGRWLNGERRIDRSQVRKIKMAALERLWTRFRDRGGDPRFDRYRSEQGETLRRFATFCALAEHHGRPWWRWPAGLRRPDSPEVIAYGDAERNRVDFHRWLQWLFEDQLRAAGHGIDVVPDLAVGVDPAGADAWLWQDCFAPGVRVGAPPDELHHEGQDWGLAPFDPWRLRLARFEPWVQIVRGALRGTGGMRLAHVAGLFRLFWIPGGASPVEGAYVGYPWRELLGILALESHRAGGWIVGEDLGAVDDWMRTELTEAGVLLSRLATFDPAPPRDFPEQAVAALSTHDLPTVTGLWTGTDLEEQRSFGLEPDEKAVLARRSRLAARLGAEGDEAPAEIIDRAYEMLAEAPCRVVVGMLEDALAVGERPNIPGTPDRLNWSLALPAPLEKIETSLPAARIGARLAGRDGSKHASPS